MTIRRVWLMSGILLTALATRGLVAQGAAETYTATASVKTAAGSAATAPVTITVDRKMSQTEADKFLAAFRTGGAAALRKALTGVPPTGSVKLGSGAATPARLTLERATSGGRLLTIVTDKPVLFVGAGVPDAKAKEGYDFAIIDLTLDAKGNGTGTLAPAAKVTVKQGAFAVEDYGAEAVQLTGVTRK